MSTNRKRLGLSSLVFALIHNHVFPYSSLSSSSISRVALNSVSRSGECGISHQSLPSSPNYLQPSNGERLAYHSIAGRSPGVILCNGFQSVMTGQKAMALEKHCRNSGLAFVRFDYRGHGSSSGIFESMTIGNWIQDTLAVLDSATEGPQILVGSSMGAWLALRVALLRPTRVVGIVGIAAAPDFTMDIWNELSPSLQDQLKNDGIYHRPSLYSKEPYPITWNLIEESRQWLLLHDPSSNDRRPSNSIPVPCPVRLLHGQKDTDCHYSKSLALQEALDCQDVIVTLIKNGNHRLSTPRDLDRLTRAIDELAFIWEDKNS